MLTGIHKAVLAAYLSDGGCLKERMGECTFFSFDREKHLRFLPDGDHVRLQFHHHASVIAEIMPSGSDKRNFCFKTAVQPNSAVIVCQDAGIERELFSGFLSPYLAVFVVNLSVEFILSCRGIADCHAEFAEKVKCIVKIISSVRPLRYIGSI